MDNICHKGTVKEIAGNTLFVEIERSAACATCQAKSACLTSNKRDEIIPVPTHEPDAFHVGEAVNIHLKKSMGAKAIVIAYLCPFLMLTVGLFVTYYFTKNELLSIGVAFGATTLYFLFIKKIENRLRKHFTFSVSKINE
ncbi:MAG: SoxR reducing system RseC family protein [Bacteroidetes bacterium]|nr:SoxR reducing system RseC family protein [Bacteroidota bacterium]MCL2301748.1 SoxR reducing system RseC family protein [Lentimicrobiaceae bacterium]